MDGGKQSTRVGDNYERRVGDGKRNSCLFGSAEYRTGEKRYYNG